MRIMGIIGRTLDENPTDIARRPLMRRTFLEFVIRTGYHVQDP